MKLKLSLLLPILIVCFLANSQQKNNISINYPQNVEAALSSKEKAMIEEVYKTESKALVFDNPKYLKELKHLMRNRILIYKEDNAKFQKQTKLLSEVPLFNDYNKDLKRDINFNSSEFNPLKYKLDFFANGTYVYRIDNTNYFIQITSQHRSTK
ncbi:MAG: hypothetical protein HKN40_10130 [Winogradskyella sp.]|uniref:hypothetical protein n=1 Tax=Winogradskyella sp. TaxID=1883156 RepID=UPI0017C9FF4E|nr:hypothetical protein [Winogradskyella sp.]